MEIPNIYNGNYKLLIIPPLLIMLLSLFFIFITPGINSGIDFQGGARMTAQTTQEVDTGEIESAFEAEGYNADVSSYRNPSGYNIEVTLPLDDEIVRAEELKTEFFSKIDDVSLLASDYAAGRISKEEYMGPRSEIDATANELFAIAGETRNAEDFENLNELQRKVSDTYADVNSEYQSEIISTLGSNVKYSNVSFESISATLSSRFLEKALGVIVWSTIFVTILVFLLFRTAIPSAAVVVGAVSDIIIALGAMAFFQIPLTLASFATLLVLIGFSLDTDVLLTMRVVKRKEGTPRQRAFDTMKTGLTMSVAVLIAFVILFALSLVTHIQTYYEISAVAIAGMIGDIIATWGINAVMILWYVEKKEKVNQ